MFTKNMICIFRSFGNNLLNICYDLFLVVLANREKVRFFQRSKTQFSSHAEFNYHVDRNRLSSGQIMNATGRSDP